MADPSPRPSAAEDLPAPPWPTTALRGPWGLEVGGVALDRSGGPVRHAAARGRRAGGPRSRRRARRAVPPRALRREGLHRPRRAPDRAGRGPRPAGLDRWRGRGVPAGRRARLPHRAARQQQDRRGARARRGLGRLAGRRRSRATSSSGSMRSRRSQGRVQPVLLRVVPEVEVATHEAIATGHDASKFGILARRCARRGRGGGLDDGDPVRRDPCPRRVPGARPRALPAIARRGWCRRSRTSATRQASRSPRSTWAAGSASRYVDERPLATDALAAAVTDRLAERCAAPDLPVPSLIVEPGRSIVANAGLTALPGGLTQAGGERADACWPSTAACPTTSGPCCTTRATRWRPCDRLPASTSRPSPSWAGTASPGTPSPRTSRCRPTPGPATCSRSRRPAPTPTRWRAATTASADPRWWGCATGSRASWLRREDAADLDRLEGPAPRAATVDRGARGHHDPARRSARRRFVHRLLDRRGGGGPVRAHRAREPSQAGVPVALPAPVDRSRGADRGGRRRRAPSWATSTSSGNDTR